MDGAVDRAPFIQHPNQLTLRVQQIVFLGVAWISGRLGHLAFKRDVEARRPPPHIRPELDIGYRFNNQSIERFDPNSPDLAMHSVVHTIVENQIALRDETPVAAALARLKSEGLDRHGAVHAIASVLVNYLHEMLSGSDTIDHNEQYFEALTELTAES